MTAPTIWIIAMLFIAAVVFSILLLIPTKAGPTSLPREHTGIDGSTEENVITVRKVGRGTPVIIRHGVHDHWEGSDSVELPQLPIEVTHREEPELYAEYMSPGTSAIRKYEIADDLYGKGYTLPWIGGLNEEYKREIKEAQEGSDPDAKVILERTSVDLTPGKCRPAAGRSNPSREDIQKHE